MHFARRGFIDDEEADLASIVAIKSESNILYDA